MNTTPRVIGAHRLLPALLTGGLLLAAAPGASAADNTLSQVLDAAKQALQGNRQEAREPPGFERPEYRERDHYDQRDDQRDYDRERYNDRNNDQRDYGRERYSDRDYDRRDYNGEQYGGRDDSDRRDYDRDGHDRYPQRAEGESAPLPPRHEPPD
jgi:hypothetical protein